MPMSFLRGRRPVVLQLSVLALSVHMFAGSSFGANWKQSLEKSIKAEYRPTKIGIRAFQFDYNRITEQGSILVVRAPGIYADVADTQKAIIKTKIVQRRSSPAKRRAGELDLHEAVSPAQCR